MSSLEKLVTSTLIAYQIKTVIKGIQVLVYAQQVYTGIEVPVLLSVIIYFRCSTKF